MSTKTAPSESSAVPSVSANAPAPQAPPLPAGPERDLAAFRNSERGKRILGWAMAEFSKAKDKQGHKRPDWFLNLAYLFGDQHVRLDRKVGTDSFGLTRVQTPKYRKQKTINRVRGWHRTEHSKFISAFPTVVSVPATGEDQDQRAAYAAQQVWESYSSSKQLRVAYDSAQWWRCALGVGFIKVWWDTSVTNFDKSKGDVCFEAPMPFNIFVPNLGEPEIENQPFVIEASTRDVGWAQLFFKDQLAGEKLTARGNGQDSFMDEAYTKHRDIPADNDQVTVLEYWVKPGRVPLLPDGGLIITVNDIIVHFQEGVIYDHGRFPYVKFDHLETKTFYSDSPIVDIRGLQDEYNESRTQVALIQKRMGNPQFIMQEGSFDPNKLTNAPGSIITYRMGFQPPQQVQPAPLPEYIFVGQERILQDIEDLTGQHEVSKGSAPTGVSAGTALAFLKESDDNFLTPQHHNTEAMMERIAIMTLSLFVQYVDTKRKIRVVGADGAFDTELLAGADIINGLDVRVEEGTSIGQSMAAKRAQVLDLVDRGLLDQQTALKMMEIGGAQKVLDIINVAGKQAQRENVKLKMLKESDIETAREEFVQKVLQNAQQQGVQINPEDPEVQQMIEASVPPIVPVNDFDMHEVHIETHNRFRMSQEFELLPDMVKQEFAKHVEQHQMYLQQIMFEQQMMAGGGGDAHEPPPDGEMSDMGPIPEGGAVDPTTALPPSDAAPSATPPGMDTPIM